MKSQNIKITTEDNFVLDGVLNWVESSDKAVVFVHGMTVNKDEEGIFVRAESGLNELGFSTLRFDFRGHGKSQGYSVDAFTIPGEIADLTAAINLIKEKGTKWLGLAAASFGGSIATLYAGRHKDQINALFLASPVLDYDKCFLDPTTPWAKENFANLFERLNINGFIEVGTRKFKLGKKLFEEMKVYRPYEELNKYKGPLLVVQGDKDSKVASEDVVDCYNTLVNSHKALKIIHGSEHGFHEEPYETQVVNMMVGFF